MIDKRSIKYHALLEYVKKRIHNQPFTKISKNLVSKGWPKEWVTQVHKDITVDALKDNSSTKTLKEGQELLGSVKQKLTHPVLHFKERYLQNKPGKDKKRNSKIPHIHLHLDFSESSGDYFEKLTSDNSNEKHFYTHKKALSELKNTTDKAETPGKPASKENFDTLHEAIKLAKEVIKAQSSVPISVKAQPFAINPTIIAAPAPSPAPVNQTTQTNQSVQKIIPNQASPSSEQIPPEQLEPAVPSLTEQKVLEEERKALQRERELLMEERKHLADSTAAVITKKPTSKKKEVTVEKSTDDSSKYFEQKLELLEARLKNMNYAEMNKNTELRNDIEVEEIEYVSEPVGDRAQTGIIGLDSIIQGGFRRLTASVIAGGPGSGKTLFAMQYLLNGITQFNENGVFITFEQTKKDLYSLFGDFGWDLEALEKEKKLTILRFTPEQISKIIDSGGGSLRDAIDSIHARRVVVDSISDLLMLYHGDMAKRRACIDLFDMFEKLNTTALVVAEQEVDPQKHVSSVLEYQVDGVILLYNERVGDIRQRGLEIFKMRGTKHAGRIFPMKITDHGIIVNTGADVLKG